MIDALSGGALMNKTLEEAWELIERQQVTPTLLKRQPDECPQPQEDNTVASTHNFYDATTIPPYNRQYYTQGRREGRPAHWIPPQQPQTQPRQPYTYSQPQNSQNPRYQPPHNRQQSSPSKNPPFNFDEAIRIVQRENHEMSDAQKRTESLLNPLAELLQKITNQSPLNPQAQAQPLVPSPLPY
ncbi:hypothetical protein PIB30_044553 [Stylosanthes scabra]|uniref:Uncharacterized protein n=1 Tax=Stylosanthes scabra TaxID=79078 RepID=A0ABU6UIM4_9FABA|nr:hypothetical protein [Stylosanthes scabra]